jgi:hypothetical protein
MNTSTSNKMLSVAGTAVLLAASIAAAQGPGGRGMGMPNYDKTTEVTVTGTVEAVVPQHNHMGGMGTHLTFKTETGPLDVHLGPANWLSEKKFEFAKGDQLTIVGSAVTFNGEKALIAREITKGEQKITLRNANGVPLWAGRGRSAQN